jgi:hypothetical protein
VLEHLVMKAYMRDGEVSCTLNSALDGNEMPGNHSHKNMFLYDLFNNADSSTDYTASNCRPISVQ